MTSSPLPNSRFRIIWSGGEVKNVSKLTGLKRSVQVAEHREGADSGLTRKSPSHVLFQPITIERMLSTDDALRRIADAASNPSIGDHIRQDLMVEVLDETGEVVLRCLLKGAWVSDYQVFTELNVDANGPAIEQAVVQFDEWEISTP